MKKFLSQVALVAMALAMVPSASAAGVSISVSSADRQTFTIDLPAGVDLETADTATVLFTTTANGNAVNISGGLTPTAIYFSADANTADTLDNTNNANGYVGITEDGAEDPAAGEDLVITLGAALPTDAAYTLAYRDSDGNYGAAMINFGTSSQVTVTASVEPTLTMSLSGSSIALGVLPTTADTYSTGNVDVTTGTNAASGADLTVASAGLVGGTSNLEIGVQDIAGGSVATAATDYYKIQSNPLGGGNAATMNADANGADVFAATGTDMTSGSITVLDGTTPATSTGTTRVTVAARAATTTEADDYSDTLTFTLTGTF